MQSTSSLVQTKLHRPPVPHDLVPRTWLLDLLNQNQERALTVISAAAGYGKTTLIAHWLQHIDRPSAWLALDEHDHDLISFLTYFVAALQTLFSDAGQETLALLGSGQAPPVRALATTLINELNDIKQPFILVVDDYHLVHDPVVHEVFNELLKHPPAALHLVLITRIDPPLNLVTLAARNQALILRAQDLRFLPAEAVAFMRQGSGRLLGDAEVAQLVERAEGWAAGLRLLRIARRQPAPVDINALRPSGERLAIDYLFNEALRQQPNEVQVALLCSAILERFCGPLLDTICRYERQPGQYPLRGDELIEWLWRANVFITPQDEEGRWFKYHALFRDLLLHELKRRCSAEAIQVLHRQASAWLVQAGLIEEAIYHALQADDVTLATRLLADYRHVLIDREQFAQLERLLKAFAPAQIKQSLELSIIEAWLRTIHGRYAELLPILDRIESRLAGASLPPATAAPIQGELSVMRANATASLYYDGAETLRLTEQALQLLPRHWRYAYTAAIMLNATGYTLIGQPRMAQERLQQALADPQLADQPRSLAWLFYGQAFVYWGELDLSQMKLVAGQYLALGQKLNLPEPLVFAQFFLGSVHYYQNHLVEAQRYFHAAVSVRALANLRVRAQVVCGLALTYLALGQTEQADELLAEEQVIALERQNFQVVSLYQACQAEIALAQGKTAEVSRWAQSYEPQLMFSVRYLYIPQLTLVKVWLAQNTSASREQATTLLSELAETARNAHIKSGQLSILILRAWLDDQQGDEAAALSKLTEAIRLAEPSGLLRLFVDHGSPLAHLLIKLSQRGVAPQFIAQILAAFPGVSANPRPIGPAQLIEPLTERELEILILLAQRLSNKEIAGQLFISAVTVKRHAINIYQKLQVNDRHEAVTKARALGLLARD